MIILGTLLIFQDKNLHLHFQKNSLSLLVSLEQNDELTAAKLRDKLTERWPTLTISAPSVHRARWKLEWRALRPKYCQLIREANKLKRL